MSVRNAGVVTPANTKAMWARSLQGHLSVLAAADATAMRQLAVAVFAVQLAACLAAVGTQIMLHGDGAYFVYALSEGEPWLLKWRDIAARAAVYVTTVAPTGWLAAFFQLDPLGISRLNGFIFYLVPTITFGIAVAMVWRSHPQYLLFPVVQYVFASGIGFGFPSEILLAPGFMWIAMFLILKNQAVSVWFAISFICLIFSHELAIPAALVVAYLGFMQAARQDVENAGRWRRAVIALTVVGTIAAFIAVRLNGGGAGSDSNAIYVIDPRRILDNPTMWIILSAIAVTIAMGRRYPDLLHRSVAATVIVVVAVLLPILIHAVLPAFDFAQGRYDSARSVIGFVMFALAVCFAVLKMSQFTSSPPTARGWISKVPLVICVAMAVGIGADTVFLYDWSIVLDRLGLIVASAETGTRPRFVSYEEARKLMPTWEAQLSDRMGFHWVLPYRSVVLANGTTPGRVIFADADYRSYCNKAGLLDPSHSRIPPSVLNDMHRFACTHEPPPPRMTRSRRFFAWLAELRGRISGK